MIYKKQEEPKVSLRPGVKSEILQRQQSDSESQKSIQRFTLEARLGSIKQKFLGFQDMEKLYSKRIHQMTPRPD